jgi:hypothetical protein
VPTLPLLLLRTPCRLTPIATPWVPRQCDRTETIVQGRRKSGDHCGSASSTSLTLPRSKKIVGVSSLVSLFGPFFGPCLTPSPLSSNLSIGYWSTAFNGAVVTQPRGKHFQALGRGIRPQRGVAPPRHPQLFLMPEEALVVFEWGGLQLEGLDSLHSGWKLAIPDVGIHRYCAYAYLKRLGFVLWRCEWPMLSLAEADCASPRSRWMDRQRPCRECRKRKHTAIRKNAQPNSDEIRRTREEGALIDVNLAGDSGTMIHLSFCFSFAFAGINGLIFFFF